MISQGFLLLIAGIFLLYEMIQGWRRGVARCLASLIALIMAGVMGYYFGLFISPFLKGLLSYPDIVVASVAGLIFGIGIYLAITIFASILLKKTSHQKSGLLRLLYGAGGAVLGCVYGLLILWGALSMVRAFGAYAESRVAPARDGVTASQPNAVESQLIQLKAALEAGSTGKTVEKVDPVPTRIYEFIVKSGQVSADPEAMDRFINDPSVQKLLQTPRMAAILNDPEVAKAATEKNYFVLIRNPRIIAAVNDAEFRKTIAEFDFNAVLDHALKKPTLDAPSSP